MSNVLRVIQSRESSKVERCHTLPHHGSYSIGQHSHDALSLYLILCPSEEVSFDVVRAIHSHDYGERWTGDVPAPAKWGSSTLKESLEEIEMDCLDSIGWSDSYLLRDKDLAWLKAVDSLELWLWAHDQMAFGNANAATIIGALNSHFSRTTLPAPVVEFIKEFQWTRTPDTLPK